MTSILDRIEEEKLVAIVRSSSSDNIIDTVKSLREGGIRCVEITMNTPDAINIIKKLKALYPDLIIGAGTVLDSESAVIAIHAGADFLLAPTLDKATITAANRYNVPLIPGILSPTEALKAYEYGAKLVKVFPANTFGSSYLKDLKGPLPFIKTMAVGGITVGNTSEYLQAGASSVGIGGSLVNDKLIASKNYEEIKRRAEQFVSKIKSL